MDTIRINQYLSRYKNYLGTYARDRLTNIRMTDNTGIIINTDKYEDPGEHWVSIYLNGKAIYFDSFGMAPRHDEIIEFLYRISPDGWYYNRKVVQSIWEDTCGLHCMNFLCCMFETQDFNQFLEAFDNPTQINDHLTRKLYKMTSPML